MDIIEKLDVYLEEGKIKDKLLNSPLTYIAGTSLGGLAAYGAGVGAGKVLNSLFNKKKKKKGRK
jgi:hypothetical protein